MTGLIDLRKKVDIVLTKRKVHNVKARVGLAIDISGSMRGLYTNNTVQSVVDRILALAMRFDDNGEMDMWTFSNGCDQLQPASEKYFNNYVNQFILNNHKIEKWNGTEYAPVINSVLTEYYPERSGKTGFLGKLFGRGKNDAAEQAKINSIPSILIMITDGANDDPSATTKLLEESQGKNIYYQFVGIGNESFRYLNQVAEKYPNAGFVSIKDLQGMADDALYEKFITDELAAWLNKSAAA